MIAPLAPPEEEFRLASLLRLGLLNTQAEERFDRLSRIAAALFEVPIALISMVDENRQWFKSCVGLEVTESGRDVSFCGHTILSQRPFIINDALTDLRFYDNPLVIGPPYVRFYAGVPLKTDDAMLVGTICIVDHQPRTFSSAQIRLLEDLACMASDEMNALGHQQTLETLRKTQDDFATIFDHAAIGMALIAPDGHWLKTNRALQRLLGYSELEMTEHSFQNVTHPDDANLHRQPVEELLNGKRDSFRMEKRYIHKDGKIIWVNVNISLLRDEQGEPLYFISQTEDITERRNAQQELIWKTAFFEAKVNSSIDGIVVVDNQGHKILQNQRMVDLWKIPREIADNPDSKRQFEWSLNMTKTADKQQERASLISANQNETHQAEVEMKDGTFLDAYSSPVIGRDGVNYGRIFGFRDITERKTSEGELGRLHAEYEQILSAVEDGVHWIGIDGLIKFENPAAHRMLGYRVGELIGKSAHRMLHHTHVDGRPYLEADCFIQKTLLDGEVRRVFDEVFWRKDGTSFPVEYTCTPIHHKGQPHGAVVTFIDVTKRKKVEQEMQNARLAAESASQAKTDFLANMSHKFALRSTGSSAWPIYLAERN